MASTALSSCSMRVGLVAGGDAACAMLLTRMGVWAAAGRAGGVCLTRVSIFHCASGFFQKQDLHREDGNNIF